MPQISAVILPLLGLVGLVCTAALAQSAARNRHRHLSTSAAGSLAGADTFGLVAPVVLDSAVASFARFVVPHLSYFSDRIFRWNEALKRSRSRA